MEKVIVFGAGNRSQRLLNNISGLEEHILLFVDNFSKEKELYGIPIVRPDVLLKERYKKMQIVITATLNYDEICRELVQKYGVKEAQILSTTNWMKELLQQPRALKLRPQKVCIESSTYCQIDCVACYMRKENLGILGNGYLTFENFKAFVDRTPYVRFIELSNNGEPFLNPDLSKILCYAFEKQITITFANGANFNDVPDDLLEALVRYRVKQINISIDGASQEIYEKYRRKGDFDKVICNIKKLNVYKEKYRCSLPQLKWKYILMNHNEEEAGKAKEMAQNLGMKILYSLDWRGDFVAKDPEKLEKITGQKIFNRREWAYINQARYNADASCAQMIFSPYINWDGRLLGCCRAFRYDWNVNVFEKGLDYALHTSDYLNSIIALLGKLNETELNQKTPCCNCVEFKYNLEHNRVIAL